ncbi:MAG: hypothetical protein C0596_07260 [Marinilabiliales bacterium]|nr:MAG: hypothetical protein C0596_07260 [Marinilabiliales bacterium]
MKKITILYLVLLIFMIISCGDQVNDSNSESGNRKTDQSDTKIEDNLLTNEDLDSLNSVDLLLLRNDIFAKHGYSFKTKPLRDYYSQFEWYNPEYDNVDSLLTEEDQKNLKLIQEYEEHFKSKEADFKKLLSQFYQAEDNTFEIFRDFEDNYSFFE